MKLPVHNYKVIEKRNKTSSAQVRSIYHQNHFAIDCVSVCFFSFFSIQYFYLFFLGGGGVCLAEAEHALEGDEERREEGKGGKTGRGDHERKKRDGERE